MLILCGETEDEDPGKIHFIVPKFWGKFACVVRHNRFAIRSCLTTPAKSHDYIPGDQYKLKIWTSNFRRDYHPFNDAETPPTVTPNATYQLFIHTFQ